VGIRKEIEKKTKKKRVETGEKSTGSFGERKNGKRHLSKPQMLLTKGQNSREKKQGTGKATPKMVREEVTGRRLLGRGGARRGQRTMPNFKTGGDEKQIKNLGEKKKNNNGGRSRK